MTKHLCRAALLAAAAFFALGSGGGGGGTQATNSGGSSGGFGGGGGGDKFVIYKETLDPGTNALPALEQGGRNMGCGVSWDKLDDGSPMLFMTCGNDGALAAAQQGDTIIVACERAKHNESSCKDYAIRVIKASQ